MDTFGLWCSASNVPPRSEEKVYTMPTALPKKAPASDDAEAFRYTTVVRYFFR